MLTWSMTKQRDTSIPLLISSQSTFLVEPNNLSEAFQDTGWRQAIQEEFQTPL